MDMKRLDEIELYKTSLQNMKDDRDKWKSACIDMVIYDQSGFRNVDKERIREIFELCYEATNVYYD